MNWITWYNIRSGNRTTRSHATDNQRDGRAVCGATVSTLVAPASRSTPRCEMCEQSIKARKLNGGLA